MDFGSIATTAALATQITTMQPGEPLVCDTTFRQYQENPGGISSNVIKTRVENQSFSETDEEQQTGIFLASAQALCY